jgi:hypothetical protein
LVYVRVQQGGNFQAMAAVAVNCVLIVFGLIEFNWLAPDFSRDEYDRLRAAVRNAAEESKAAKVTADAHQAVEQQRRDEDASMFGSAYAELSVSIGLFPNGVIPEPWAEFLRAAREIIRRGHAALASAKEDQRRLQSVLELSHEACRLALKYFQSACNEFAKAVAAARDPFTRSEGASLLVLRSPDGDIYYHQHEETNRLMKYLLIRALFAARGVDNPPAQATLADAFIHYDFEFLRAVQRHQFHVDFPVLRANRIEIEDTVRRYTNVPSHAGFDAQDPRIPLTPARDLNRHNTVSSSSRPEQDPYGATEGVTKVNGQPHFDIARTEDSRGLATN